MAKKKTKKGAEGSKSGGAACSVIALNRLRRFLSTNFDNNGKNKINVGLHGWDADPVGRAIFVIRQYDEQLKEARAK